jgi:hypothetical protein
MRFLLALVLGIAFSSAASAQQITGTYKLISFTTNYSDGSSVDVFGKQPSGYIIITPKRFMALLVSDTRKTGTTPEDKIALYGSLISYSGPYSIEGSKLTTSIDISWNQAWTGTKQSRTFTVEGDRLILVTDKAPTALDPTKIASSRLVWARVE